jgi:hypothetical protein
MKMTSVDSITTQFQGMQLYPVQLRKIFQLLNNSLDMLKGPYVSMQTRKNLKYYLYLVVVKDLSPPLVTEARKLQDILSSFFGHSHQKITSVVRKRITSFLDNVKTVLIALYPAFDATDVLPADRIAAVDQIVESVVSPYEVVFSTESFGDESTFVYLSDGSITKKVSDDINALLLKHDVSGTVEVLFAENGTTVIDARQESFCDFLVSGGPVEKYEASTVSDASAGLFEPCGTVGVIVQVVDIDDNKKLGFITASHICAGSEAL